MAQDPQEALTSCPSSGCWNMTIISSLPKKLGPVVHVEIPLFVSQDSPPSTVALPRVNAQISDPHSRVFLNLVHPSGAITKWHPGRGPCSWADPWPSLQAVTVLVEEQKRVQAFLQQLGMLMAFKHMVSALVFLQSFHTSKRALRVAYSRMCRLATLKPRDGL